MRDFNTAGPVQADRHQGLVAPEPPLRLRAVGRGRRLRDRLAAAFESELLKDGMDHPPNV